VIDERAAALLSRISKSRTVRFTELLLVVPNPRTLSSKLKLLEADGLVEKDRGTYRCTSAGEEASSLVAGYSRLLARKASVQGFERIPHPYYARVLRDYTDLLLSSYGEGLLGVALFGSVARGDWKKESDIDLLVVVDGWEGRREWARIRELVSLKGRLARTASHVDALRNGFVPAIAELPLAPSQLLEFRTVYLDIALDGVILLDRKGELKKFVDSVRAWGEASGSKRVVSLDGSFYWVIASARPGDVVQLGVER